MERNSGGIGFIGLLLILFIGLKLAKVIDWSWWWVLSPLWLSFIIIFVLLAILLIIKIFSNDRKLY